MPIIKAPNRTYNGVTAGVPFVNGEGRTEDAWLIQWFKENGYTVEEAPKKEAPKKKV